MVEPPSAAPAEPRAPEDRLDSWKEIAAYLKRDVTTVQRWEKRERMPVRRHVHDKIGSVYAFRSELDAWARSRNLLVSPETAPPPAAGEAPAPAEALPRPPRRARAIWALAGGALVLALVATAWILLRTDSFWRNPLAAARFQSVTDFGGTEQAANVSRDGRFVAFLSDRDGRMDVWVTQVGTGMFYNLTRGRVAELVNPSVRTLGFSPDGALVTFWARGVEGSNNRDIGIWAVPTLGGQPRPYLEGAAEFDWSSDGAHLAFHTAGPGDPMFVRDPGQRGEERPIFSAAPGLHGHFPLWSRDGDYIYFVQGTLPDSMDIWRIRPTGGAVERITHHNSRVSHPVLLDHRTLAYLATDGEGAGPWLHSIDVERRVPHRLGAGLDRYTSLASSADGRRLVATRANPRGTLWRLPIAETPASASQANPISLTTSRGFSPRLGRGYLLYVSSKGTSDGIWKLAEGAPTELWSAPEARVIGGPEVAPAGDRVAFSVEQRGRTFLYVVNADGTNAKAVTESLALRGGPAWMPDGRSIVSAVVVDGTPQLYRISLDGSSERMVQEYSVDPVWSPDGEFLVYSGADVGTRFTVKAVTAAGRSHPFPDLTLSRGARRMRFLPGRHALVVLRGGIQHKDLVAHRSADGWGAPADRPAARFQRARLRHLARRARGRPRACTGSLRRRAGGSAAQRVRSRVRRVPRPGRASAPASVAACAGGAVRRRARSGP